MLSNKYRQEILERGSDSALNSDTLYFALVTAVPNPANGTRGDLTRVSGGSYVDQVMTGRSIVNAGNGEYLTCTNPVWLGLYAATATPIVGYAVLRRLTGSFLDTDPWLIFNQFANAQTIANCTTIANSLTVTSTNTFPTGIEDTLITGTNIPSGTVIKERVDANTIRLSNRASGGSGALTLNLLVPASHPPATALPGSNFTLQIPVQGILTSNVGA